MVPGAYGHRQRKNYRSMDKPVKKQKVVSGPYRLNGDDGKLYAHLNSCVHCGLCAETCVYYLATGDERLMPARKVDLVASVYKRYHTFLGRTMPGLVGARDLDEAMADEMVDLLFGACTMCGRCSIHCSIGVDISYLVRTGRSMLAEMGKIPKTLQSSVDLALSTGNNMGITEEELRDTLNWLEEELRDETGDPEARIPIDEPDAEYLYTLNPREPKFFPLSVTAMARVFHAAGVSWTLSSKMYDVTNYAYYTGDVSQAATIAQHMVTEMERLRAGKLVLAECGHGSRALRWEAPNYLGHTFPFDVITSVELMSDFIRDGRIKVEKRQTKGPVTLHDPCNLARTGGIWKEQRYVLSQTVADFVEMHPHGIDNLCCGGGGGQLAMSEYNERRMKIAECKAAQIRNTGARIVVSPCHNCIDQLMQINGAFRMGVQIKTLSEIVADALVSESNDVTT